MDTAASMAFPPDGRNFSRFLDHAMRRGLVPPNVGAAYKTTCLEVLPAALGPHWHAVDMTTVDVDELLERFQVERGRRLPPDVLKGYTSRLVGALELFRRFVRDNRPNPNSPDEPDPMTGPGRNEEPRRRSRRSTASAGAERLTYPFPLRSDVVVSICLPADLTVQESGRLARFLEALVVDDTGFATTARNGQASTAARRNGRRARPAAREG